MPTKFPIFDQRYAINSLTAALEGGEYGTPPSLSDAEALVQVLEQYRADFLQRGFLVSVAMGAAAFVKMDPFWILHKPRQWGKLGRLSAVRNHPHAGAPTPFALSLSLSHPHSF